MGKDHLTLRSKVGNLEILHKIWDCAEAKVRRKEIKNKFL